MMRHGTKYSYYDKKCRCETCCASAKCKTKKARKRTRLPVAPMLEELPSEFIKRSPNLISYWEKNGGVTVYEADKYCCRYGKHPAAVFGHLWLSDMWAKP